MVKLRLKREAVLTVLARKGLSQGALSRQLGVTPAYMSMLLSGRRCVGLRLRPRIENAPSLRHLEFDQLFEVLLPDRQHDAA